MEHNIGHQHEDGTRKNIVDQGVATTSRDTVVSVLDSDEDDFSAWDDVDDDILISEGTFRLRSVGIIPYLETLGQLVVARQVIIGVTKVYKNGCCPIYFVSLRLAAGL